jgi:PAS domain S-box-containing protein
MATFTETKGNRRGLVYAFKLIFQPLFISGFIVAIALITSISRLPVSNLEAEKFHILLLIVTVLLIVLLFIISKNLAARAKSENERKKSAKEISDYKSALDASAIVVITDQKGIILHANDNFCKISKYSHEELIGQDHRIINSGYHSKEFIRKLWVTIVNGKIWKGELKNRAKDGTTYWVDTTIVPFLNEKGKPYQYMAIRLDITERKKAEEAEKNTRANLAAIIENTDSSIYSLGTDYRYITFNQVLYSTLKQVYGLEIRPGDHVYHFLEKLDPKEADGWREIYSRAFKGETVKFEREFNINTFNSFSRFSIYPIWENGTVIGLSCFVLDITEQKKAELEKKRLTADLIQRNKALEEFSYIVSHNLRSPVANILGLSNIIKTTTLTQKEKEKTRDYLFTAVEQLDTVIKDLNQMIDVKRDIQETKEKINFSELVNNIEASIHTCIEKRHAKIITDFSSITTIFSVRSYVYNIFYNLLANSVKYSQPGIAPIINIKSEKKDGKLFLYFSDNGLGINMKLCRDKIFGMYHRFHPEFEGKGMGLFMVKTQVEALGGKITVQSEINKGTEFILEFNLPQ